MKFVVGPNAFFSLASTPGPPGANSSGPMYRTLSQVFPTVYAVPIYDVNAGWIMGEINIILFGTQETTRAGRGEWVARAGRVGGKLVPATDLAEYAAHLLEVPVEIKDVPTLTDDFAPVEILRASRAGSPAMRQLGDWRCGSPIAQLPDCQIAELVFGLTRTGGV